jgi:SHAQKYF class myb-like DNA-binding protein
MNSTELAETTSISALAVPEVASSSLAAASEQSVLPMPQTQATSTLLPTLVTSSAGAAAAAARLKKKTSSVSSAVAMPSADTNQLALPPGAAGENTGRWTAEEHRLFLQGLEQHGKGWKKIASLIKSRTVVQIRTHAQKYFQKLAKARQNGDEGDVTMEGRGGAASVTSDVASLSGAGAVAGGTILLPAHITAKRRQRQITGTKRKTIQSVVSSAVRQGKKMAAAQAAAGIPNPMPPLPAVAPALAHFVLPTTFLAAEAQGTIAGSVLEDSLYVFVAMWDR